MVEGPQGSSKGAVSSFGILSLAVLLGCAEPGDSSASDSSTSGPTEPAYVINGQHVEPGQAGPDGTASLHASVGGDLNQDGRDDRAVILTLDSSGSGVFYHLNVFLDDGAGGWRLGGEEFLGDRIKFDFLDIYAEGSVSAITGVPIHPDDYGQLVVAFFVHSSDQSFSDEPSLYLTRHWRLGDDRLVPVEAF